MKPQILCISLACLSALVGCADPLGKNRSRTAASRGNEEMKQSLLLGAGSFRPAPLKSSARFGLAQGSIHSLKIDPLSGNWAWVSFDTSKSDAIAAGSDLEAWARSFVLKYENDLGLSPDELSGLGSSVSEPYPGIMQIAFGRQYQGLAVKGAFLQIFLAEQADKSYRLSEIVNNSYGPIKIKTADAPLGDDQALAATGLDDVSIMSKVHLIQPTATADGRYDFVHATEFKIKANASDELFTVTLANADGTIHEAYSNHVFERHELHAETFERSYILKDQSTRPLQFATILAGGKEINTDENGAFEVDGKSISIKLLGQRSATGVVNQGVDANDFFSFPVTLDASGKTVIKLNSVDVASINTFVAVQEVANFVAKFLTPEQLPILKEGIPSNVNINDSCNAFYNGQSLNFFKQGGGCANTGLISDIVIHEWGHALDDFLGTRNRTRGDSGITDGAYSEGIGDILSSFLTKSSNLAPGFFLNNNRPLRNIQNNRTHPPANAAEAEVHSAGLIIGGAFWDMFSNFSNLYGDELSQTVSSELFLKHLIVSDRYVDAYQAVLRLDDNDKNAATRSPHFCLITRAFARHNLSGGDEAGNECVDTDTSLRVRVELDQGEGRVLLAAAAAGASSIVACPGKLKTLCADDAEGRQLFTPDESEAPAQVKRRLFNAKGEIDLSKSSVYTLISLDSQNKVLGTKTLSFKAKEKTTATP